MGISLNKVSKTKDKTAISSISLSIWIDSNCIIVQMFRILFDLPWSLICMRIYCCSLILKDISHTCLFSMMICIIFSFTCALCLQMKGFLIPSKSFLTQTAIFIACFVFLTSLSHNLNVLHNPSVDFMSSDLVPHFCFVHFASLATDLLIKVLFHHRVLYISTSVLVQTKKTGFCWILQQISCFFLLFIAFYH